jgi:Putative prokaryotic signal transducing protein
MNPSSSLPYPAHARMASDTQADEEPPHGDLVTVTRVFNSLEAEMLRGCLVSEGIPATLGDAQTIQTDTLLTVALGGIRVMVPSSFAEAARQTVNAFERGELAIDELPADSEPAAPEVESEATSGFRMSPAAWAVLAIVVVAVVIF